VPLDPAANCTVCIPTYRQSVYLAAAVASVVAQTYPVRLLVSNDASPDDTAEVIAGLQRRYAFAAVNHVENRGMYQHCQWLLRQPRTKYIMRLDSDDLLQPAYMATLIELLERHPAAGYAHCSVEEIDSSGRVLKVRAVARTWEFEDGATALRRQLGGFQVAANIVLFRRDALEAGDRVDPTNDLTGVEDWDRGVRLSAAGWGNVHSPLVLASYRVHDGPERPRAGRKLRELVGLHALFSGNLLRAWQSRGWDEAELRKRRVEIALACSDVLDLAEFGPGERQAMCDELIKLAADPSVSFVFAENALGRLARGSLRLNHGVMQQTKRWIKRVLYSSGDASSNTFLTALRHALGRN
jgi:cellulose synthase/poly-beta-1,6-N-acetylglucosamine synthase-like glycosyltransferase